MPDDAQLLEDLDDLYEHAPCGYVSSDGAGLVVRVNATLLTWTGHDRADVVGASLRDLLTPGSRTYFDTHYLPLLHVRREVREVALDLVTADGRPLPVLVNSTVVRDGDGAVVVVRTSLFPASERRSYERELVRARSAAEGSEQRLRVLHDAVTTFAQAQDLAAVASAVAAAVDAVAPAAGVAVWLVEPRTLDVRRRCVRGTDELAPAQLDPAGVLPAEQALRRREPVTVFEVPGRPGATGTVRSALAAPILLDEQVVGVYQATYGRMRSFTAAELETHTGLLHQAGLAVHRVRLLAELRHAALHDPLTGAANRVHFENGVLSALHDVRPERQPVALLLLDLDDFKAVNDSFGHFRGDELLVELARRLQDGLAEHQLLARLGGDEFAVLAPGADEPAAARIADRMLAAIADRIPLGRTSVTVTGSVGVAVHHGGGDEPMPTPDGLRHLADIALYRAKAEGKNRHRVHDEQLRAELERQGWVAGELRRALAEGDLLAYYQPVFDLRTGRMVGAETLCRLRTGGRVLLPGEFLPVATEQGLLDQLGRRMLELACRELASWARQGRADLSLSVNVAAQQAARVDFADEVLQVVGAAGCDPARLHLELTESALLEVSPATVDNLRRLREAGVGVVLDDFGTRYASLHYVQQFPITALKIDRSFVAGLPAGRTEAAIVRSVAALAEGLGVDCVAEGIETDPQHEFLAALGVRGQGFGLARPMPAEELRSRLRHEAGIGDGDDPEGR